MADFSPARIITPLSGIDRTNVYGPYFTGRSIFTQTSFSETKYLNRVYNFTVGKFIYWITYSSPDKTGASYPGPGSFSSDTQDYVLLDL